LTDRCDVWTGWFGYHRVAHQYNGSTIPSYSCNKTLGTCSLESSNTSLGIEVGFTYPLQYETTPGTFSPKIAEGDYYVTVKGVLNLNAGNQNQNDNFIFDIGNFLDNQSTSPMGISNYATKYLPGLNYLNMYRAQGPYGPLPLGDGTAGGGANGCVLPKQMRVISGNAASITISDSDSSLKPTLDIDSFTLSHTPPKDSSGNYVPLCPMLSGTPSAQWIQPSTSNSFFAPLTGPNTSPPAIFFKVNGEAAQGSTIIDHIEAHATMEAAPFTDYILDPISPPDVVNPFRFIWPYSADPWSPIPPDGQYTLSAVAVDANGFTTNPPTTITGVTIDTLKPQVSASYVGENPFKEEVIDGVTHIKTTVTATDLNGISNMYVYSVAENRIVAYCNPPSGTYPSTFNCNVDFVPQASPWDQGSFSVIANDRAGNNNSKSYYSDTAAPTVDPFVITQTGPNPDGSYTGTVTITATDTNPVGTGSIKKIQLYSGIEAGYVGSACDYSTPYNTSESCGIVFYTLYPLNNGDFYGYAIDANGNVGSYHFDLDTQNPTYSFFTGDGTPVASKTTYKDTVTMRATVADAQSGLDYVEMWTYRLGSGGIHTNYTPIGTCDYNGENSATCQISWNVDALSGTSRIWPLGIGYYIELRVRDVRGRMISPSWGPVEIIN